MLRLLQVGIAGFGVSYFCVHYFALTAAASPRWEEVFFSPVLLGCSGFFFLLLGLDASSKRGEYRLPGWLVFGGFALVCVGHWMSFAGRFSAEAVITEGQTISVSEMRAAVDTAYNGKFARVPETTLTLDSLTPDFTQDSKRLRALTGKFRGVQGNGREAVFQIGITGAANIGGMRATIDGFGFSPRYELKRAEGGILDSSFVFLDLFPPGYEDYFRLLSPLTYYVRYYPFGGDVKGDPFLRIRIARNKDIVLDRDVKIGEEFAYENARMSFPEIRRWTKITVTKDPGRPAFVGGGILALLGPVIAMVRKSGRNDSQTSGGE